MVFHSERIAKGEDARMELNRELDGISVVSLEDAKDAALLRTVLLQADIFLHNLAPGALSKRGFGGDALRTGNPGLITCEITGYGSEGEAAKKKARDFLVQAEAGLCAVTGTPDGPVMIPIRNDRELRAFCGTIFGQPGLADDPRFARNPDRVIHRDALTAIIETVFGQYGRDTLIPMLDSARIVCARLNEVEDLSAHPFPRNTEVRFGNAEISIADLPVRTDAGRRPQVPGLGEHTDAIRIEFGSDA